MWRSDRVRADAGFGMPLVVIVGSVLAVLAVALTTLSVREAGRVTQHRQREAALHLAETAVEHVASELSADPAYDTGDVRPTFASEDEERAWAVESAASKSAAPGSAAGQWVAVKPVGVNVIYGVGYAPSRAEAQALRVVRVEYDTAPLVPPASFMSNGDIDVSGNPAVTGAYGNVHANGDVTGSGNPTIAGYLSASGTYTPTGTVTVGDAANTGGGRPYRYVPRIDPRAHYGTAQYDLCADGTVRTGPSYPGPEPANVGTPCAGTILATVGGNSYRGWRFRGQSGSRGAVWSYTGTATYDGVYYIVAGSAEVHGSPGSTDRPWVTTIFAEASAAGAEPNCPHTGGDIEVIGSPAMRFHPKAHPLLLVAGRDLVTSGTAAGGDASFQGILAAHEQIRLGGNASMTAAVLAEDACDTSDSPQNGSSSMSGNPRIHYDLALEVPFGSQVRLTSWLEL